MAKHLTAGERAAIVAALEAGESVRATAKQSGRDAATVSRLGKAAGVDSQRCFPEKAAAARDAVRVAARDFDLAARLDLLNALAEKVANLVASAQDAGEVQRLTVAAGILIDKRRLEDGDVTSRNEVRTDQATDAFDRRVVDLAARRRPAGDSRGPESGSQSLEAG